MTPIWLGLIVVALIVMALGLLPALHLPRLPACKGIEVPWWALWNECWTHGATLVFLGAVGFVLSLWALVIWRLITWLMGRVRATTGPRSAGWILLCALVVVSSLAATLFLLWSAFWQLFL